MDHLEVLTVLLEKDIIPLFNKFMKIVERHTDGRDISTMTSGQRAFFIGPVADDLREPAIEFGEKASNFESTARQADAELRAYVAELYAIDSAKAEQELGVFRSAVQGGFAVVEEFIAETNGLEKSLRIALSSVKLRRTLSPITTGVRALKTAAGIVNSWQKLGL